jgi:hypothetical protein
MVKRAMTVAVLTLGVFAFAGRAEVQDETWVLNHARQIKESDTTAWSRIPWASSLLAARRASEKENRPVFLFTHDGNIETGRC